MQVKKTAQAKYSVHDFANSNLDTTNFSRNQKYREARTQSKVSNIVDTNMLDENLTSERLFA